MKKAFVDLDGTLINSKKRHEVVLHDALTKYNIHFNNDQLKNYVDYKADGKSTKEYLSDVLKLDKDSQVNVNKYWIDNIENNEYLILDELYDDAEIFLKELKDKDYLINILSARRNKDYIINYLKNSRINKYIDDIKIVSPYDALNEKSLYIKDDISNKSIVVGDSEVDYYAGYNNDVVTYILNRGFRSKKYWDNLNVKSFNNLFDIIESF